HSRHRWRHGAWSVLLLVGFKRVHELTREVISACRLARDPAMRRELVELLEEVRPLGALLGILRVGAAIRVDVAAAVCPPLGVLGIELARRPALPERPRWWSGRRRLLLRGRRRRLRGRPPPGLGPR